jgi:death-on-curing protein
MTNIEYLSSNDIRAIHGAVVESDMETAPGIKSPGDIEFAVTYISEGYYGEVPETIHEKVAHLMRLIAGGHPFVDGNKRTALDAAEMSYQLNGYHFDYGHEVEDILEDFAKNADRVDIDRAMQDNHSGTEQIMATVTDREQELVEAIKTADTSDERRQAIRELATYNIEHHQPVYDALSRK